MNASVAFVADQKRDSNANAAAQPVILIPASAVHDHAVFLVLDGKALRRPVKTGAVSGQRVRIEEGLIGGENLISNPPAGLKDGDKVRQKG
jgi:HlyD family secretion protein